MIDCGPLDSPTNGQVVTSEGTLFERQAVYSCRLGYEVNGLITRVCQVSQEWSGVEPTCSRKSIVVYICSGLYYLHLVALCICVHIPVSYIIIYIYIIRKCIYVVMIKSVYIAI